MSESLGESLLEHIHTPQDIKQLRVEELPRLCAEIRAYMLEVLSSTPGHLAAGLGVVELTVALHYVFNLPQDKLLWDVGHQSYPHKILSGRRKAFSTLRQWGGLSGFTHPKESPYDAFISGHASTSISAALGMAVADNLTQNDGNHVIAVIGDGAMTGGLAFEGLNNAASQPNNLLIILNDNNISIDPSTGGLSKYLVDLTTNKTYNELRQKGAECLEKLHLLTDNRRKKLQRLNNTFKGLLSKEEPNFFEGFSIRYFGPMDGHDVVTLVERLKLIRDFKGPKLLHLKTEKGKGYTPAEQDAVIWHAPGKFNKETGVRKAIPPLCDAPQKFQDVFGYTLLDLAQQDKKIVGITPAMISGSSFGFMQQAFPERVFDVGIAEGHAVTFSAGLAMNGLIPFCNIYSSFLQRGYDQVIHDVAMQQAPLILCIDRAGLVGEDGMTHHGLYDISYLRAIPGLNLMSPIDEWELRMMMYTAYRHLSTHGPMIIRYPRGEGSNGHWRKSFVALPFGKSEEVTRGEKVCFVSYGPIGANVKEAVNQLNSEGIQVGHINLRFLKPLDTECLENIAKRYEHIITVENGALAGGVGSALLEYYNDKRTAVQIHRVGVKDEYIRHGSVNIQLSYIGLDAASLAEKGRHLFHDKVE